MCSKYVPEVRAGSSWGGWQGEEEDLHSRNPDWQGRWVWLHLLTDSSHERTGWKALQPVGLKEGGQHTWTPINTANTWWYGK